MGETQDDLGVTTQTRERDLERQQNDGADSDRTVVAPDHPDAPIRDAGGGGPQLSSSVEDLETDSSPPTPRFIQDESSWKRFKWVPYPVRRWIKISVKWTKGPPVPRRFHINPLLPRAQQYPIVLLDKYLPKKLHRAIAVLVYYVVWIVAFALTMRQGQSATELAGWGKPVNIGCGAAYWVSGNGCGIDGLDCRPFDDGGFAFRCPGNCASYHVLNPHAVGDQEINYRSFVIGGPPAGRDEPAVYRGDSFICGSAIHAGVISDSTGGCGVVKLVGQQTNFNSTNRNGIKSIGFDSYFPLSITFEQDIKCDSKDPRWSLLAISVVMSTVFSLFVTSPALFFFTMFTGLFWTTGMAMDTPNYSDVASLFSREIGLYLPAMFVAWVMYDKMGVRRTLKGLTAQVEKTVLWLGGAWVGALTNYTFDFIPIQRLNAHDLQQQPGARAALAIIVIILAVIAIMQIWFFRQEGRLVSHLKLYGLFAAGIIICLCLPRLNLRIHHYILALLLLPGTSMQTRPSLLFQGLLLGLFINGIARWGFDPVLQTAAALRADAPLDSPLPEILEPTFSSSPDNRTESITFNWVPPPASGGKSVLGTSQYDGISVLVNDVERFRKYFDDGPGGTVSNITWNRRADLELPEYFRFAWMSGSTAWDYTKAGEWDAEGKWTEMRPGPAMKARDNGGEGGEWSVNREVVMGELRKRGPL
ncbi:hypothetical protein QBC35DRAFT_160061 [Podospora australis]|uniref:LCCL domain-containing protein n=1 Tax=Podospora australis TaxID=1536484 RepID=A0AAN6X7W0_9PEZI|nr:hypothetical protein QBC35DRAFT_160061 [Podospora australis]